MNPRFEQWRDAYVAHHGHEPGMDDAWQAGRDHARNAKLPPLPTPFRSRGQQVAEDGCSVMFCDCFCREQMMTYAGQAVSADPAPSPPSIGGEA